jgi:hypothetical protein
MNDPPLELSALADSIPGPGPEVRERLMVRLESLIEAELNTSQPSRRRRPGPWGHRLVVVAVTAVILAVFFAPMPHLSLFNRLVAPATGGSSTNPPVSHGPWPERLLAHANISPSGAVLVSGASSDPRQSFVVGFENNGCIDPCPEPLVRLDPQTGSLTIGPLVSADSSIETVGRHVLLFTAHQVSPSGNVSGGWALRTVDVAALKLGPPVPLAFLGNTYFARATGGVSGTNDIWVGDVRSNWLLNTSTDRVVRQVSVSSFGGSLALSPDGRTLYELGSREAGVREVDANTGQVLATRSRSDVQGIYGVAPVNSGAWIMTFRPSVILFSSDHLRRLALAAAALPPAPPSVHDYEEFSLYALGPFVLIQSSRGMTCVAPDEGSLRATALWTAKQVPKWTPVAVSGHNLIAVEQTGFSSSEVFTVQVPAACFG